MKHFLLTAVIVVCFAACNNGKNYTATTKNADGTETKTSVDVKSMSTATDEMNKKIEELKKLTPYTLDQLKALLPAELNGMKQSNYNSSTAMGYALISADYKKDDTTSLQVSVYDCAGEAGSAWYGMAYWSKMSFQQESSTEYTKTVDFMGGKAVENYNNQSKRASLTFAANDRLLVVLQGDNMKPDELKEAAQKLNLKVS